MLYKVFRKYLFASIRRLKNTKVFKNDLVEVRRGCLSFLACVAAGRGLVELVFPCLFHVEFVLIFFYNPFSSNLFKPLLLHRSYPHIDLILCRNQNGFRKDRSTLTQIRALRRIIEELRVIKAKDASNSWFAIQTEEEGTWCPPTHPVQALTAVKREKFAKVSKVLQS